MENKRIKVVKNWPKLKLLRDIQIFLDFTNIYQRFIQNFKKIAGLLSLMLRTRLTQSAKNLLLLVNVAEDTKAGVGGGDRKDKIGRRSLRFQNLSGANYLTPKARLAFTILRQALIKALILKHFDPECLMRIETNASGFAIGRVLSQLTLDNLSQ